MEYLKIEDAAARWGISPRRLQTLCAEGRIAGATRFGRAWMIPLTAAKPTDGRTKQGRSSSTAYAAQPMPRKTPFLHMSDLYHTPGEAQESIDRLADNHEAQVLLAAEIAYSRGEIDTVYQQAHYLLERHSGFYAVLSAGMLLALCAIWRGDLAMWRQAKIHIAEAPMTDDHDRDIVLFSLLAVDSMLYDVASFPEWFKTGCFESLHRDALPAAKVFYAKYLYAAAYAVATRQIALDGVHGLSLMSIVPCTIEPMISQAMADRSVIAEIYLRLTCATVYNTSGNTAQAVRHIDRAVALALPDKLYGVLAEYCRVLGGLLEERITRADGAAWLQVRRLFAEYNAGWTRLSGSVRGKNLATTLSVREREVAKLAAFGMQNSEIAAKMHMSLSGVKQAVRIVSEKTGVGRDEFAAIL